MNGIQQELTRIAGKIDGRRDCAGVSCYLVHICFFFQAEDGIRDLTVTGVQTCALPISWVKQGILVGFRIGTLHEWQAGALSFVDKATYPPRKFETPDRVRLVPGGSSVRRDRESGV